MIPQLKVSDYQIAHKGRSLPPLKTPLQYLLTANGLYKRAANSVLDATIPVKRFDRPLPDLADLRPTVELKIPRLPEYWLEAILEDFRRACNPELKEAMVQVVVKENRRVELLIPQQQANAARLRYQRPKDGVILCDIHSHHVMPAYFSERDDKDETGLQLYAVMGKIFKKPEMRLRAGVYGQRWGFPLTALFTGPGPFRDVYNGGPYAAVYPKER